MREQSDVDEALRLMRMSKISLSDEDGGRGGTDVISAVYSRIRDDATRNKQATYTWPQLTALFTGKDYTVCCPSRLTLTSRCGACAAAATLSCTTTCCSTAPRIAKSVDMHIIRFALIVHDHQTDAGTSNRDLLA